MKQKRHIINDLYANTSMYVVKYIPLNTGCTYSSQEALFMFAIHTTSIVTSIAWGAAVKGAISI